MNYATDTSVFIQALGWALCHSLWQGLLIYSILRLTLSFVNSRNSSIRYNISLLAMLGTTVWFADTLRHYWQQLHTVAISITDNAENTATTTRIVNTHATDAAAATLPHLLQGIEAYFPAIVCLYITGIALLAIRLILGFRQVKKLSTTNVLPPEQTMLYRLDFWQQQLDIKRPVKLLLSRTVDVPMIIGTLKPVILLPLATAMQLAPAQVEAILLHELAHVRRNDYLVNIFQTLAETILFFNPFAWLISRIIRREREHCCDDVVATYTQPMVYAQALASLETHRHQQRLALAANGQTKTHLLNRIKRILEMKANTTTKNHIVGVSIMAFILMLSLICFVPGFAQPKKDDKKKAARKETRIWVHEEKITVEDSNGNRKTYTSLEDMPQPERKRLLQQQEEGNEEVLYGMEGKKLVQKGDSVTVITARNEATAIRDTAVASIQKEMETIDWSGIGKNINKTLQGLDMERGDSAALAAIDWRAISDEISSAMKDMDWKEIDKEVRQSMREAEKAMSEVDWKEINKSMLKAEKLMDSVDRRKLHADMEKASIDSRNAMAEARRAMAEAREAAHAASTQRYAEVMSKNMKAVPNSFDRMISSMQQDGLLNRKDGFKVEKKRGNLYINGAKQSQTVYDKYERYLGGKKATVKGVDKKMEITIEE